MGQSPQPLLLVFYGASLLSLLVGLAAAKTRHYTFNVRQLVFFIRGFKFCLARLYVYYMKVYALVTD